MSLLEEFKEYSYARYEKVDFVDNTPRELISQIFPRGVDKIISDLANLNHMPVNFQLSEKLLPDIADIVSKLAGLIDSGLRVKNGTRPYLIMERLDATSILFIFPRSNRVDMNRLSFTKSKDHYASDNIIVLCFGSEKLTSEAMTDMEFHLVRAKVEEKPKDGLDPFIIDTPYDYEFDHEDKIPSIMEHGETLVILDQKFTEDDEGIDVDSKVKVMDPTTGFEISVDPEVLVRDYLLKAESYSNSLDYPIKRIKKLQTISIDSLGGSEGYNEIYAYGVRVDNQNLNDWEHVLDIAEVKGQPYVLLVQTQFDVNDDPTKFRFFLIPVLKENKVVIRDRDYIKLGRNQVIIKWMDLHYEEGLYVDEFEYRICGLFSGYVAITDGVKIWIVDPNDGNVIKEIRFGILRVETLDIKIVQSRTDNIIVTVDNMIYVVDIGIGLVQKIYTSSRIVDLTKFKDGFAVANQHQTIDVYSPM